MEIMNTARVSAYAKLNLTLDILGASGGYHELESAVVTIDLADRIVARRRGDGLCTVLMHGEGCETLEPEHNQALIAAEKFVKRFGTEGADITVWKNIPVGAGLGGSSADAAGALNALAMLYGVDDRAALKELADECGSDTGFLLGGGAAVIGGRGEKVYPIPAFPKVYALLLCPKEGVSTAECYRKFDELNTPSPRRTPLFTEAIASGASHAGRFLGNALFPAARELAPSVGEALLELKALSPLGASMTGSGSAVFALFETPELVSWAKSRYNGNCRAYAVKSVFPRR